MATFDVSFSENEQFNVSFSEDHGMSANFGEVIRVATSDYNGLSNKPKINDVEVVGEKTGPDYHLQNQLTAGSGIILDGDTISADQQFATYSEVMNYLNS